MATTPDAASASAVKHNPAFTIISAEPGWQVAVYVPAKSKSEPNEAAHFWFMPIIAWMIEHERRHPTQRTPSQQYLHFVDPITPRGTMDDWINDWGIRWPDGRVQILDGQVCDDEATALRELEAFARRTAV